jgi:hypothetical protein
MRDTCEIHVSSLVSSEVIKIHAGYMRNTCGIHAGYMRDTYLRGLGRVWGYPSAAASRARDTYLDVFHVYIHVSRDVSHMYRYPECILNVSCVSRTCNAGQKYANAENTQKQNTLRMAYRSLMRVEPRPGADLPFSGCTHNLVRTEAEFQRCPHVRIHARWSASFLG